MDVGICSSKGEHFLPLVGKEKEVVKIMGDMLSN
jgi:hypothetical protein